MQDRGGVIAAAWRRWPFVVVGAILTLIASAAASLLVPAQHAVTARVLLLPPPAPEQSVRNPYLALGGLGPAASVLAATMSAAEGSRVLQQAGVTGDYTISPDYIIEGPVLLVEVEGETAQAALATLDVIVDQAPRTLRELQAQVGVPSSSSITATVISRDAQPVLVRRGQVRAVLVAAALGGAGTLLGVSLLDSLLLLRRQRRAADVASSVTPVSGYKPVHLSRTRSRLRNSNEVRDPPVASDHLM